MLFPQQRAALTWQNSISFGGIDGIFRLIWTRLFACDIAALVQLLSGSRSVGGVQKGAKGFQVPALLNH